MHTFLLILTAVLLLTIFLMLQRLFRGPTIFDRMNGLQPGMYVDLALAYAMMGCLGSVILAKYLGGKKL